MEKKLKIKIYSTENCSNCERLKKILEENNIDYEEIEAEISDLITNFNVFTSPAIEINSMIFSYTYG